MAELDPGEPLILPLHKVVRVSASGEEGLAGTRFEVVPPGLVDVEPGQGDDERVLVPLHEGTGTLRIQSDGDPSIGVWPLGQVNPITVMHGPAVAVRVTFQVLPGGTPRGVSPFSGEAHLPLELTALVIVEGIDATGQVVPLTNPVWESGNTNVFTIAVQADPQRAILTPVGEGFTPLSFTAEAHPLDPELLIEANPQIHVIPAISTTMSVDATLEAK